jgi:hypothetical protein
MGAAITGLRLGEEGNVRTLSSSELEAARDAFLQDLRSAAVTGDAVAARLQGYYEDAGSP